jgi:hypothetical protein
MKNRNNDFENFITGNGLLNFTLCVWVVFLMHTYTRILWRISPEAKEFESLLQVVESIALGLVTFLIIRRARHMSVKILFALYEFLAVFFYYTPEWQGYLTAYIATLCASSVFGLGYISTQSYKERKQEDGKEEAQVNSEILRLTELLEGSQSELTQAQRLVTQSNSEVSLLQNEVSCFQQEVTQLQKQVTQLANGVTLREAELTAQLEEKMSQIEAQTHLFNQYKAQTIEWERAYLKEKNANDKRSHSMKNKVAPTVE